MIGLRPPIDPKPDSETDKEPSELLKWLTELFSPPMDESSAQLTEKNIEMLLNLMISAARRPLIETEIEVDNARLRVRYLEETPLRREDDLVSLWKGEGKVFAIRLWGFNFYPDFQFEDEAPRAIIKDVLDELPNDMTDWQVAMWFASGNGWLDGVAPQECLSDPDAVINAAQQLSHPAIG